MGKKNTILSKLAKPYATSTGVFVLVCCLYMVGILEFLDFQIFDTLFRLHQRPASQSIVIVEMDSKSIKELVVWPWPRSLYATAIDKISKAGAKNIIVDVDFSSRSKADEDTILQTALKNAEPDIFLPIFQQFSGHNSGKQLIETLPNTDFLPFIEMASANYLPESDGLIRVQKINHRYGNRDIISFSAVIAKNIPIFHNLFFIDYGIQPNTIPRISFIDLIRGEFDPETLAGKNVIIGATALELGDIKSTPVYRTLPGPEVIAISYESIVQNRMLQLVPLVICLPLLLLVCILTAILFNRLNWKAACLLWLGLSLSLFVLSSFIQGVSIWLLEISPMLIATTLTFLLSILRETEMQSLKLLLQSIEIRRSDMMMRTVVENSFDSIIVSDENGFILLANPSTDLIFGYDHGEVIGKHISGLFAAASLVKTTDEFPENLRKENKTQQLFGIRSDGVVFDLETTVRSMVTEEHQNFAIFFRDITAQQEQARLLEHQAYYDALTDLPNRLLLSDRVESAVKSSRRTNKKFALLLIDLDHFKEVNDTLGHAMGDTLLINVANRLKNAIRDSDTVARLGGDEFAILLLDINDTYNAGLLAQKVLDDISEQFNIKDDVLSSDISLSIEASIGVTLFPEHGETIEDLMKHVDIAMYTAKNEKAGFSVYDAQSDTYNMRRLILSGELRSAIENEDLFLCYHPQVKLATGKLSGFEALMRWNHTEYGMVSPAEFVDMAERSGLIHTLTNFALKAAIAQTGIWLKEGLDITMSINLSMRNLQDVALPDIVKELLNEHQVPPERLILEATETAMMTNSDITIQTLQTLKDLGVHISIDDFGTGHSSLQYIKDMPLYELKIDQSFVMTMLDEERSRSIVETIVALSNALKLEIVAEGIETVEIAAELSRMGCQIGQGYYFSKPMKASEVINWIEEQDLPGSKTKRFLNQIENKVENLN